MPSSIDLHLTLLRQGLSWNQLAISPWLADQRTPSTHLSPFPRARIIDSHSHAQLLMSSEDSNSDPHACSKCSYPPSISPAPRKWFFFFTKKRSGVQWLAFSGEATTILGKKQTSIPLRKEKQINSDKLTPVTNTWISASITHSPWDMCSGGANNSVNQSLPPVLYSLLEIWDNYMWREQQQQTRRPPQQTLEYLCVVETRPIYSSDWEQSHKPKGVRERALSHMESKSTAVLLL